MRTEFAAGARNAVRACLNIGDKDRVAIIRDRTRMEIAEAIEEEAVATERKTGGGIADREAGAVSARSQATQGLGIADVEHGEKGVGRPVDPIEDDAVAVGWVSVSVTHLFCFRGGRSGGLRHRTALRAAAA